MSWGAGLHNPKSGERGVLLGSNAKAGAYREIIEKELRAQMLYSENHGDRSKSRRRAWDDGSKIAGVRTNTNKHPFSLAHNEGIEPESKKNSSEKETRQDHAVMDEEFNDIYARAIRISDPILVDNEKPVDRGNGIVERRVIRHVEVPYTHKVKVPVKTQKIVPKKVKKKVRTTRLVQVPAFKYIDEYYDDYENEQKVRKKRTVKVPITTIQRVPDYQVVELDDAEAIEVDGFRIDEVQDTKVLEVEEWQQYEMRPQPTGKSRIHQIREVRASSSSSSSSPSSSGNMFGRPSSRGLRNGLIPTPRRSDKDDSNSRDDTNINAKIRAKIEEAKKKRGRPSTERRGVRNNHSEGNSDDNSSTVTPRSCSSRRSTPRSSRAVTPRDTRFYHPKQSSHRNRTGRRIQNGSVTSRGRKRSSNRPYTPGIPSVPARQRVATSFDDFAIQGSTIPLDNRRDVSVAAPANFYDSRRYY